MLGIVIDTDVYPVISAAKLQSECEALGLDTSWWEDKANVVSLIGGLGPSEAHLLLPYSTILLLNSTDPSENHGDEQGLDEDGDENDVGANYYDRVIRLFQCIKENPAFDDEEEEDPTENPRFIAANQDLKGWVFVGSRAIDPARNSQTATTVHLARFVNALQGFTEVVGGTRSLNRNPVTTWNTNDTGRDAWGFTISDETTKWSAITSTLWEDVFFHYPNAKYFEVPITFIYPEFPEFGEEEYFNDRPHNLNFKDLTPWEAFVEFCHKISHEIFPKFDGTMTVATIDAFANESTTWASDTSLRPLEIQFGEDLYTRIRFLVDHDHPPSVALVPHSFTAVFSRTTVSTETLAVPPIALWRGPGHTVTTGGMLPIQETGLFTQLLVTDSDTFDSDFLDDHPYVLSGDYEGKHGDDRAERSFTQYVDCTFFAMLTSDTTGEGDIADIDRADDGLRHPATAQFLYPLPDIANLIAKRHLKALMMGDLGTVTLSGFHNFEPNTRHQEIHFNGGVDGPTTSLVGYYSPGKLFPREVTTRNINPNKDTFTGLAVVVSTVPADVLDLPSYTPSGASGDYSGFEQPSFGGQALPLTYNTDDYLVPNVPDGAPDVSPYLVDFLGVRDDVQISAGTLVFITNRIAHVLSACDYIRYAPSDDVTIESDQILIKQSTGRIVWGTAEDFQGPEGPPGGGGGDSVAPGYGIDTSGTGTVSIINDPTEWTGWSTTANTMQFFHHDDTATLGTVTDPSWKTVTNYDPGEDQMWWHKNGSFKFQTTDDYDSGKMQMLVNFSDAWKWIETIDYNDNIEQILWHRADADTAKRWKWQTTSDYDPAKTQIILNVADNWSFKEVAAFTAKIPTAISLSIVGSPPSAVLRVKIDYAQYTLYGKADGTGSMQGDVPLKPC